MRATERTRAFVLPYTMAIAAIFIAIAGLVLTQAQNIELNTHTMEDKNASFNAAEAGLNAALDALDTSLLSVAGGSATLANGYRYRYAIYPNLLGTLSTLLQDPITGQGTVVIPVGSAVVVSTGTGATGARPTTVEALVAVNAATITFQKYAIVAGRNIQGDDSDGVRDVSGAGGAALHAGGSINASFTGGVAGAATASGNKNTLPPYTTHAAEIALSTVSQFDTMVADYENQTKLYPGGANIFLAKDAALSSSYACPSTATSGCLLFYDGALALDSQQVTFSGPWTVVINGELRQMGTSSLTFTVPGVIVVNGNASIEGGGISEAYLQVKGNTTFGGPGDFKGALLALGNVSLNSSNPGWFDYDASVVPPPKIIAGLVKVVTYAEY